MWSQNKILTFTGIKFIQAILKRVTVYFLYYKRYFGNLVNEKFILFFINLNEKVKKLMIYKYSPYLLLYIIQHKRSQILIK